MEQASFVFIDEFDAFYHFEFSESVQKRLGKISGVQIFTTTHNTDLMSNDLLRPDCYFLLKDNKIKAIITINNINIIAIITLPAGENIRKAGSCR